MADIKDILGVSRDATPGPKAEKPKPEKRIKPKGMSREAFALLSGSHPLMPSQLVGEVTKKSGLAALKEKRKVSSRGQVTYEYQHFDNPARTDGLRLQHWVKCYRDAAGRVTPAETEYNFAKYNKRALVLRYNDEEWDHLIDPEPGWSREETDYLLDLCSLFDLRWMAIADRYEFPGAPARSIEDLKGRYYSLARQLVVGREGGPETVANQSLLKHPYDPRAERERKKGLELLLARSQQQDAEENVILEEARKIDARRRQEEAARQRQAAPAAAAAGPAANGAGPAAAATPSGAAAAAAVPEPAQILEISRDPPPGLSSLFDARGQPTVPTNEVTARATNQRELAEDVMKKINPAKLQKSVEGSMAELGQGAFPRCATRQTCGAYLSLQQEVIQLLDLKRRVQLKQAGLSGPPRKGGVKRADSDTETPRSEKRQRVNKKFADD